MSVYNQKLNYLKSHGAQECGIMFRMPCGSVGCMDEFGRVEWIKGPSSASRGTAMVTADDDQLYDILNQGC